MKIDETFIRSLPKVVLHDHLDGGLRSQTVVDLAKEQHYNGLPTTDAGDLAAWFHRGAQRGSLPLYLEGFAHTCGVMQTADALERVAYEMMEDMHRDDAQSDPRRSRERMNSLCAPTPTRYCPSRRWRGSSTSTPEPCTPPPRMVASALVTTLGRLALIRSRGRYNYAA